MSNTLLTIGMITRKALAVLENELTFTKLVNRDYDDQFAVKGAKVGSTINIRKPPRYIGRRTATLSVEGTTETSTPLVLNTQYGCDVSFTSAERTLDIDDFAERILKPQIATVANMIDEDGLRQYLNVFQTTGTGGVTPATSGAYLAAQTILDDAAAPRDGMRNLVISPKANEVIVPALQGLFNPQRQLSDQYEKGMMSKDTLGFNWYMDQNVRRHTVGVYAANVAGGAVTVNGAVTTGSTVITAGWTSGDLLAAGDVVTFSGVYSINPQSRQPTADLQRFVVTDVPTAATGGGAMTISIAPAVVFSGAYQTVSSSTNSIASGATLLVKTGTTGLITPQNMAFHRDAFTFGCADLELPRGVHEADRVSSKKLGLSIRMVTAYDINNDRFPTRLDLLGGWATQRPELACRILG
jgi:hypothetical protein